MTVQISSLEIQLIKSSLGTKTDQEIAELLEIPVDDVIEYINEITDGAADDRNGDILKAREETNREKNKKKAVADYKVHEETRKQIREKEKMAQANIAEKRAVEKKNQHQFRKYKTKDQEFDKQISIKVDIKTWVLAPAGSDPAKVKAQYIKNLKR